MIDRILKIMKENNGIITPAQLEKKNIKSIFIKNGKRRNN